MKRLIWACAFLLLAGQLWALELSLVTGSQTQTFEQTVVTSTDYAKVLKTSTPWTDDVEEFKGVYLEEFLAMNGVKKTQGQVTLIAWNDYSVSAPLEDLIKGKAFLAVERNGETMKLRDKGPFWLIFNWEAPLSISSLDAELWSVWQIKQIKVE